LENEWSSHLMALQIVTDVMEGVYKCRGFANAGVCFGFVFCYRGVISDEFAYLLGDGEIRLDARGETPDLIDSAIANSDTAITKKYHI